MTPLNSGERRGVRKVIKVIKVIKSVCVYIFNEQVQA